MRNHTIAVVKVFFLLSLAAFSNITLAQQGTAITLTQAEAIEKAKAFYDSKGEWAGKFTITKVHQVRFEQSGPKSVVAHIRYQAGFLRDLTKTVEDQRTFGFTYQGGWVVQWMGGHKSARF